jgi:hypothetical protein
MEPKWQSVYVASGEIEAQQVRAFLEAAGIQTTFRGETLRITHGLTLDGLGAVDILVREYDVNRALELLASADAGSLWLDDDEEEDG